MLQQCSVSLGGNFKLCTVLCISGLAGMKEVRKDAKSRHFEEG
jgi:hypothetical protein